MARTGFFATVGCWPAPRSERSRSAVRAPGRALGARAEPEQISVFAAASLADALGEVGRAWEKASGCRAVFNFGASSDLSRQIRVRSARRRLLLGGHRADGRARARRAGPRRGPAGPPVQYTRRDRAAPPPAHGRGPARPRRLRDDRGSRPASGSGRGLRTPLARRPGALDRARCRGSSRRSTCAPRSPPSSRRTPRRASSTGPTPPPRSARASPSRWRAGRDRRSAIRSLRSCARHSPAASAFVGYLRSPDARAVFTRHGFLVLGGE